jgi:TRAP transporter TAXI family solute receptor
MVMLATINTRGSALLVAAACVFVGLCMRALPCAAAEPVFRPDGIPAKQFTSDHAKTGDQRQYYLSIYSGSTSGVYYYVASALCEALRARYEEHHIHCSPLRSQGVGSNRGLMNQGRAQFAIVQSDTNYYAATGEVPMPGARSVASLHDELGVLVMGKRTKIAKLQDLKYKRINLGPKKSAAHTLWVEYLDSLGLTEKDMEKAVTFAQDINYQGICDNYIDAFGLWSGHPVPALTDAIERCGLTLAGMGHPEIGTLLDKHKYYFRNELPAKVYPGQNEPLVSYGIKASLIAHEKADPYIVYWLTRVIIENVDFLRTQHPTLTHLKTHDMFALGNFLPMHDGAARYWREIGWLPKEGVSLH